MKPVYHFIIHRIKLLLNLTKVVECYKMTKIKWIMDESNRKDVRSELSRIEKDSKDLHPMEATIHWTIKIQSTDSNSPKHNH